MNRKKPKLKHQHTDQDPGVDNLPSGTFTPLAAAPNTDSRKTSISKACTIRQVRRHLIRQIENRSGDNRDKKQDEPGANPKMQRQRSPKRMFTTPKLAKIFDHEVPPRLEKNARPIIITDTPPSTSMADRNASPRE